MPRINVYLNDNTGAEYTGDEQVIFVPGPIKIKTGQEDDNKCVYISASDYAKAADKYFELTDESALKSAKESKEAEIVDIQKQIADLQKEIDEPADLESQTAAQAKKEQLEDQILKIREEIEKIQEAIEAVQETLSKELQCLAIIENYLQRNYDVIYCEADIDSNPNLNFLLDKDLYNVKFLTTGTNHPIKAVIDGDKKQVTFDFSILNTLMSIARARKDCIVIASVSYSTEDCVKAGITGDVLADCIKAAALGETSIKVTGGVETTINIEVAKDAGLVTADDIGKFATLIIPNEKTTLVSTKGSVEFTVPASFAYLMALGTCMGKNQYWLPVANSARGSVESLGTPDLTVTKYHMDQEIILDENTIAFNGIVKIRPYGNVIWGDRTLLKLTNSVKASGYTSLMLMVCDISKEAYNASVRYTYESNNEVTWLSYKSRITTLLDQMVTAGVLQSYDVAKMPADTYNKIVCRITIYPNLPVENFDIYINLENAELQLENA